jgi:AcrR family transcriptional regulator
MKAAKRSREPAGRLRPKNLEDLVRHFILDHSEELFIAKGYQRTSMDMIARACGLSKPTLYNYFRGKHEIFTRLYQRLYRILADRVRSVIAQGKDPRRTLEDVLEQFFVWLCSKKDFLRMYFREQHLVIHADIDAHMEWHVRSKREMVALLSRVLADLVRPEVKKRFGVDIIASTLFNVLDGLISDLNLRDEVEVSTQKKLLLELLTSGVLIEK